MRYSSRRTDQYSLGGTTIGAGIIFVSVAFATRNRARRHRRNSRADIITEARRQTRIEVLLTCAGLLFIYQKHRIHSKCGMTTSEVRRICQAISQALPARFGPVPQSFRLTKYLRSPGGFGTVLTSTVAAILITYKFFSAYWLKYSSAH